jgi:arabinofuranosyltransferase
MVRFSGPIWISSFPFEDKPQEHRVNPEVVGRRFLGRSWICGIFLLLTTAVLLVRIASEAWVSEDALITFRTIDNFVNGYGLRWNIDERVQVFTHPLWMLLNAGAYAITREIPYTLTAISLALCTATFLVVARRLVARPWVLLLAFFIPWFTSKTLVLYGTSGFETSLGFLLLALFTIEMLRVDDARTIRWGLLSLLAALAVANRFDHVLLFAPPLIYLCFTNWRRVRWGHVALGMSPLIAWLLFSLFYYGFVFPNSARAKLAPEIPVSQYVREGIIYTADLIRWDPASVPILVFAMMVAVGALVRWRSRSGEASAGGLAALGVGIILYACYILRVGGGFLSGRFWAPPLFAGLLVIAFGCEDLVRQLRRAGTKTATAAVVGGVAVMIATYVFGFSLESFEGRGEIMGRSSAHMYLTSDLTWEMTEVAEKWRVDGLTLRYRAGKSNAQVVKLSGTIGFRGLAAGRDVTFIDYHALADPLLARLPLEDREAWRVGHLKRIVPPGYIYARRTNSLDQMDPLLREYYRHLRAVVSGPLFSWKRLGTIIDFHLGRYDHLLDQWRRD